MWVRLAAWMIADREVPTPYVGAVLSGVGVRVFGAVVTAEPDTPDGIVALPGGAAPYEVLYRLTGRAGEPRNFKAVSGQGNEHAGAEFVLVIGGESYQVQFDGWAHQVSTGSRVTVTGRASIVGDYEWEAFELTDSRADWVINDVAHGEHGDTMVALATSRVGHGPPGLP